MKKLAILLFASTLFACTPKDKPTPATDEAAPIEVDSTVYSVSRDGSSIILTPKQIVHKGKP